MKPQLPHLLFLSTLTSAAHLTIQVPANNILPNPSTLSSSTHATLHAAGAPLSVPLNRQNAFVFSTVPVGSYLLEVHARDFAFEPLRVDVADEGGKEYVKSWQTFRGREWDNKGEKRGEGEASVAGGKAKAVLQVKAVGAMDYHAKRQGFSVLTLFSNPMILIAIFSLGLIVGMPYLLENMDPETKAEFEAMQKDRGGAANPAAAVQNFDLAGWMAGATSSGSSTPAVAEKPANGGGRQRRKG